MSIYKFVRDATRRAPRSYFQRKALLQLGVCVSFWLWVIFCHLCTNSAVAGCRLKMINIRVCICNHCRQKKEAKLLRQKRRIKCRQKHQYCRVSENFHAETTLKDSFLFCADMHGTCKILCFGFRLSLTSSATSWKTLFPLHEPFKTALNTWERLCYRRQRNRVCLFLQIELKQWLERERERESYEDDEGLLILLKGWTRTTAA